MNILHITAHMGDGAGKAISGLAILGSREGKHKHSILLLDIPIKHNHIERCRNNGIEILEGSKINQAMSVADVIILSWWGGRTMEAFLADFPEIPCSVLLWSHKNGYYDPQFPKGFVEKFDGLLASSPFTLENTDWCKNATLVYGFGDFEPEKVPVKMDYSIKDGAFTIGYVGMPSYKRLPQDCIDYFTEVIHLIPNVRFVMAGEVSDEFRCDIEKSGFVQYFNLLGWVGNIPSLLQKFDVFGYLMRPDTSATTENSVLEAMAAAVPCVVSRQPVGKYLLEDKISGFLVDTPKEYGELLHELYADVSLRKCIGEAGRKYVINNYCAADNLKRFNAACERVVGRHIQ